MLEALLSQMRAEAALLRSALAYPADPASAARLQEEQFAAVRQNTPGMMAANACNALVLLATFLGTPLAARAFFWSGGVLAVSFYIFLRSWRRGPSRRAFEPTSVDRRAAAYAFALGSLWAAVPPLFFLEAGSGAQMMVISLTAGMMFGGAFSLARAPLAATIFSAPIAVAATVTLLYGRDADFSHIAIVLWVYLGVLLRGVFVEAASFRERVLTQIGVEREARTDALTRLPNRLAFTDAIEREFARMRRSGAGFLLLSVDLDDFKAVNDQFGHLAGDELLEEAARRMRASLRLSDIVARLGGDEFAVIATDVSSHEAAITVAERIVACFDEPFMLDGAPVRGSASVGGALAPKDADDPRELMKNADIALYEAKRHGDCWRLFEVAHEPGASEARAMEQDLRRALSLGQFVHVFAPVLDLSTGRIAACEAKLLWRHPVRGDVGPAVFRPIAERLGLDLDICRWSIHDACAAAAQLPDDVRVAVNVCAREIGRADFAEGFLSALESADLAPRRLALEVFGPIVGQAGAESALIKLSRAGVAITLDDIGSESASLESLSKLPLDGAKIGPGFVGALPEGRDCAAIVAAMAGLATALGLRFGAEGVETRGQADWLRAKGCREAQGGFLAAPMPLQELRAFIQDWRAESVAAEPARHKRA